MFLRSFVGLTLLSLGISLYCSSACIAHESVCNTSTFGDCTVCAVSIYSMVPNQTGCVLLNQTQVSFDWFRWWMWIWRPQFPYRVSLLHHLQLLVVVYMKWVGSMVRGIFSKKPIKSGCPITCLRSGWILSLWGPGVTPIRSWWWLMV